MKQGRRRSLPSSVGWVSSRLGRKVIALFPGIHWLESLDHNVQDLPSHTYFQMPHLPSWSSLTCSECWWRDPWVGEGDEAEPQVPCKLVGTAPACAAFPICKIRSLWTGTSLQTCAASYHGKAWASLIFVYLLCLYKGWLWESMPHISEIEWRPV